MHQLRVPAMLAGAVDIALNDDGLGVVEQQLMRRSTEKPERRLNAVTPGSGVLVAVELDESRPGSNPTWRRRPVVGYARV
ncbi:hypothetical protein REG_p0029 (plasmid) [Candidatus Regiella insecticola LSR1]|uniref:Uncharacterized protein n=1 Tax=Candidatus Regiella insecticola LSR1 TaxID=663321 RepID=E0R9B1_9ENTR|nr:hypothetical protein REG_p0029 [Candidatus Regiella insecticola LSR1]